MTQDKVSIPPLISNGQIPLLLKNWRIVSFMASSPAAHFMGEEAEPILPGDLVAGGGAKRALGLYPDPACPFRFSRPVGSIAMW